MKSCGTLAEACKALKSGGRLVIEMMHRDCILRTMTSESLVERDGDTMTDHTSFDLITGRLYTDRTTVRNGVTQTIRYFVRLFPYTELRDWLTQAGFSSVTVTGEHSTELSFDTRRMVVVANR